VTPRSGELMIGATQDFLTGAYLITQKDHFMTREKFCQLVNSFLVDEDATLKIDIPKPAIVKVSHAIDFNCHGGYIFNFSHWSCGLASNCSA
jgi:DNA-directed RNA polymerase beta' subunit